MNKLNLIKQEVTATKSDIETMLQALENMDKATTEALVKLGAIRNGNNNAGKK